MTQPRTDPGATESSMSSHADTIRTDLQLAVEQIDALLAENQRYEKALERIAPIMEQWADPPPRGVIAIAKIAREALAG